MVFARFNRFIQGEGIVQPGLIEVGCSQIPNDIVADLSDYVRIKRKGNTVDAAIAKVRSGSRVVTDGSVKEIGVPSTDTLASSVDLAVQKSGRTTGHTTGTVTAIDVTVNVGYTTQCNGGRSYTATFNNQFLVSGSSGPFSLGGDSGSVIFEDVATSPRAVGLLFAGNSVMTVGNPIDAVLSRFGVTMVGGDSVPTPTGSIMGLVMDSTGAAIQGASVQADTGQSDTTNSQGSYTLSDVPIGSRSVTASALGFQPDTLSVGVVDGQTSPLDFWLQPVSPPTGLSVGCVTYETFGGRGATKHLRVTVTVVDNLSTPAAGVQVAADVDLNGSPWKSTNATTDSSGSAVFEFKNAPDGTYTTNVTGLNGTGNVTQPGNSFEKGTEPSPSWSCASQSTATSRVSMSRPSPSAFGQAIAAKRRNEAQLFAASNQVVGVGVGAVGGEATIEVYMASGDPTERGKLPTRLDGFRVQPITTGAFVAGLECQKKRD